MLQSIPFADRLWIGLDAEELPLGSLPSMELELALSQLCCAPLQPGMLGANTVVVLLMCSVASLTEVLRGDVSVVSVRRGANVGVYEICRMISS